jgi:hypothetical protein
MNVRMRLPRELYDRVRADLRRPHPFAAERVGFMFAKLGNAATNDPLVLFTDYSSLADDRYINDPYSGARIDGAAIRGAMQEVIDRRQGVFHVHIHEFPGRPWFSWMDREELPRLIPSFQAVGPAYPHGLFLMSEDECTAEVWMPGSKQPIEPAQITLVGYPMQIFDGVTP